MESQVISHPDEIQSSFSSLSIQAFTSFASLADLQNAPGRNAWEVKVFESLRLFEKLWRLQTENREALFRSGGESLN